MKRRILLVSLLVVAMVGSACTSSGKDSASTKPVASGTTSGSGSGAAATTAAAGPGRTGGSTPTGSTGVNAPGSANEATPAELIASAKLDPLPTDVVLQSTDGSAFVGSRPSFTFRNTATGAVVVASVDGAAGQTRDTVPLPAGTYTVASANTFVSPTGSYSVQNIAPTQITVTGVQTDVPATVSFGLKVQRSPFELTVDSVATDQIGVTWQTIDNAAVTGYQLRLTEGADPAASQSNGEAVALKDETSTSAVAANLTPDTLYTLTLFGARSDGTAAAFRSVSVTTPKADGSTPSFSLAPNTIQPTDFAALKALPLPNQRVQVTLTSSNSTRSSATAIPGVDLATLTDGCVPGLPFLASSDVAGMQTFYGLVESCSTPSSWRASEEAPITAVIDTNVPLAAVIPFLDFQNAQEHACYDSAGQPLPDNAALCKGIDTDGDGMQDTEESALGTDPASASDNWKTFLDEGTRAVSSTSTTGDQPAVTDLQPPTGLGTGEIQVTLLWSTGDDLDLAVKDPTGAQVNYDARRSANGGELDHDDQGEVSCPTSTATNARAENVYWKGNAPKGTYSVTASNYATASNSRPACVAQTQARLEIRINHTLVQERVLTVGVDGAATFTVTTDAPYNQPVTLKPPALPTGAGRSGDLVVSVLWADQPNLGLQITNPGGTKVIKGSEASAVDGAYSVDSAGTACTAKVANKDDDVVYQQPATGTYTVTLVNAGSSFCSHARIQAWVEVRLRDVVILREYVAVPDPTLRKNTSIWPDPPATVTFTVPALTPGWRASDAEPTSKVASDTLNFKRAPKVNCEGKGSAEFDPGFGFSEFHNVDFTLKGGTMRWDIRAGATAYVDPTVKLEAGVECSLDVEGATFQLTTTPVPINLELTPVVEGSATGTFELKGPRLEMTFGVKTTGDISASIENCGWGWFKIPCKLAVDTKVTAEPIGSFTKGSATLTASATLKLGVGVEATLGVGVKNSFVTAKAGFAIKMKPVVGTATVSAAITASSPDSIGPINRQQVYDYLLQVTRRSTVRAGVGPDGTLVLNSNRPLFTVIGPTVPQNSTAGYICQDGGRPEYYLQSGYGNQALACKDAVCVDGNEKFGDSIYSWKTLSSSCAKAKCVVSNRTINLGKNWTVVEMCPQERLPLGGAALPTPAQISRGLADLAPPFNRYLRGSILGQQLATAPKVKVGQTGPRRLVGPVTGTKCSDGVDPVAFDVITTIYDSQGTPFVDTTAAFRCHDASCLIKGKNTAIFESDDSNCDDNEAKCVVGGAVVTSTASDSVNCRQRVPLPTTPVGTTGQVSVKTTACASLSLGAELGVDLRVETFVLAWGKDRRYPLWEGEFQYPNAKFKIGTGDC